MIKILTLDFLSYIFYSQTARAMHIFSQTISGKKKLECRSRAHRLISKMAPEPSGQNERLGSVYWTFFGVRPLAGAISIAIVNQELPLYIKQAAAEYSM